MLVFHRFAVTFKIVRKQFPISTFLDILMVVLMISMFYKSQDELPYMYSGLAHLIPGNLWCNNY